jgi:hypothetical protein
MMKPLRMKTWTPKPEIQIFCISALNAVSEYHEGSRQAFKSQGVKQLCHARLACREDDQISNAVIGTNQITRAS